MTQLKIIALAISCSAITNIAVAELQTDRAVINDSASRISATANFPTPVSGDLYVATQINGKYIFFTDKGEFLPTATPFSQNTEHVGKVTILDLPAEGSSPGRYPLYQVITNPGTDPLDFNNWVGGLGGLSKINFTIGLPTEQSGDFNNDGFADDDSNKDGFHDDDKNYNGFHDDDSDNDGFHDDDKDRNGHRDSEENNNLDPTTPININCSGNESGSENDGSSDDNCINNIPTPAPVPTTPVSGNSIITEGLTAYASCASSSCHGANPAFNQNGILDARNPSATMEAIAGNKGGMGVLSAIITADSANKISAYLNSL